MEDQEEYPYYEDDNNPLEGTTKINDDSHNTTANNFTAPFNQGFYQDR